MTRNTISEEQQDLANIDSMSTAGDEHVHLGYQEQDVPQYSASSINLQINIKQELKVKHPHQ